MNAPFALECYRESVAAVAESVYETMLGLAVRQRAIHGDLPAMSFTGALYYVGTWKGALLLECTREQAMDWAARYLSADPPVAIEDARDCLAELTNVIAGNLKPFLPPAIDLSLPSVVEGDDYSLRICGGNLADTLVFEDPLGPFRITLVEVV
jgi:CheY-specific phosphatase CheX